ncbi:MAG: hypothetical protein ACYCPS_05665 [Candidatus Saccharimonadales bacterium]
MSDALTDIARDKKRGRVFASFLASLLDFLKEPTDERKNLILQIAVSCDDIPRGYWGGQTNLAKKAPELLERLTRADKSAWGWLLYAALGATYDQFAQLQKISPWPDKKMAYLSYQDRSDNFAEVLRDALHAAGNGTLFGGNPEGYFEYVVFYENNDTLLQIAESAVCVGAGYSRYTTDKNIPHVWPVSHRLDYLRERQQKFNVLAAARASFAS